MSNETTAPKLGKGQMRCYRCRNAVPLKDGDWHNLQLQQVFLCNRCAREELKDKEGSSHGQAE